MIRCYKPKTVFAMIDRSHCLAPGLFRSIAKGKRSAECLEASHIILGASQKEVHFAAPELLGVDDLLIFQAVIGLAGPHGFNLAAYPSSQIVQQLVDSLCCRGSAKSEVYRGLAIRVSDIMKEISFSNSGAKRIQVVSSLRRLASVTVSVTEYPDHDGSSMLLGFLQQSDQPRIFIALNPLLSKPLLDKQQHAYIEMTEVRAKLSDPARILHYRLCGWIDRSGRPRQIRLDSICDYIWSNSETDVHPSTIRRRNSTARNACKELASLGWTVSETTRDTFLISRPDAKSPCRHTLECVTSGHMDSKQSDQSRPML